MLYQGNLRDLGLAIALLCQVKEWSQADLVRATGIDKKTIGETVNGTNRPTSKTLNRIAKAFGVEVAFLEQLAPVCGRIRRAYESATGGGAAAALAAGEAGPDLAGKIGGAALQAMAPFLLNLSQLDRKSPRVEDHAWADAVWKTIEARQAYDQSLMVEVLLGDDRSWALAVRICLASQAFAAHRADEALRLARLAVRLAEHDPWEEPWRQLLLGWAEPFLANAHRVAGDLAAAAKTFVCADQHWSQGEGGDPAGLLDASRRLDLKANLLQYDGNLQGALALLDQALAGAQTDHARGRLLIMRSTTLKMAGDYETSFTALHEAEPLVDARQEPRLPWAILFNRADLYCHLDRYQDASGLLPRVEAMAAALGTELDSWRLRWLKGRTWLGLGRREDAFEALAQVREHFDTEKIAYDYSLVSTELATLHLEKGETRIVKELAGEMYWIFKGQQVHENALAALTLFCQAAKKEEAGAEWTRELVKYLYRAQHRPELRFGG